MREERTLVEAFAKAADGYSLDDVLGAAANVLLNGIRQSHPKHIDAEEHLRSLHDIMQKLLRDKHYYEDGTRNDRQIILPSLLPMLG